MPKEVSSCHPRGRFTHWSEDLVICRQGLMGSNWFLRLVLFILVLGLNSGTWTASSPKTETDVAARNATNTWTKAGSGFLMLSTVTFTSGGMICLRYSTKSLVEKWAPDILNPGLRTLAKVDHDKRTKKRDDRFVRIQLKSMSTKTAGDGEVQEQEVGNSRLGFQPRKMWPDDLNKNRPILWKHCPKWSPTK